jgi:pyruvate/2-oxoglutarate dehydrogenase complex dihydrolipoamide acyltransferase (E2) component
VTHGVTLIAKIAVAPDLWSTAVMPEGLIEKWLFPDGSLVEAGDPVAAVRIEDALHELMAPVRGRLSIALGANSVIEPGMVIGNIVRQHSESNSGHQHMT